MYEAHFGLSGPPFQLNPDSAFYFDSRVHGEALAYLKYGIAQRQGFIVLTGEIGAGKTTLVKTLLERLDKSIAAAHVVSSQLESSDLIRAVLTTFGAAAPGSSKAELVSALEAYLKGLAGEGRSALLVIDEAQNLSADALEDLRLVSNFQAGDRSLLQIVLVGQPELRGLLHAPELDQLRQRIFASCHLGPLAPDDARAYVEHRLTRVGWSGAPAISAHAFQKIFECSGGLPRRINRLCNRLLVAAYLSELAEISPRLVVDTATALHAEIGDSVERPSGVAMEVDRAYMDLVNQLREPDTEAMPQAQPEPHPPPTPVTADARFAPRIDLPFLDDLEPRPETIARPATAPVMTPALSLEPAPAHAVAVVEHRDLPEPAKRASRPRALAVLSALLLASAGGAWVFQGGLRPAAVADADRPAPTVGGPAAERTAAAAPAHTTNPAAQGVAGPAAPAPPPTAAAAAALPVAAAVVPAEPVLAAVARAPEAPIAGIASAPAINARGRDAAPSGIVVARVRAPMPRPVPARPRARVAPEAPTITVAPPPNRYPASGTPKAYPGPCTDTIAALGLCSGALKKE